MVDADNSEVLVGHFALIVEKESSYFGHIGEVQSTSGSFACVRLLSLKEVLGWDRIWFEGKEIKVARRLSLAEVLARQKM